MILEAATGFEPVNNDALHRCPNHWAVAAIKSMQFVFPEFPSKSKKTKQTGTSKKYGSRFAPRSEAGANRNPRWNGAGIYAFKQETVFLDTLEAVRAIFTLTTRAVFLFFNKLHTQIPF